MAGRVVNAKARFMRYLRKDAKKKTSTKLVPPTRKCRKSSTKDKFTNYTVTSSGSFQITSNLNALRKRLRSRNMFERTVASRTRRAKDRV